MQITVDRNELTNALNSAVRCVDTRGRVIPVLATMRLQAADGFLSVTGTDLDSSTRIEIPITKNVTAEMDVCVDGRTITSLVARLTDDLVTFSVDEKNLVIERDRGDIKLRTTPVEQYPEVSFGSESKVAFEAVEFAELCKSVLLGTTEEAFLTTSFHNVAEISIERNLIEGKFRCLSTDTHRLAVIDGLCHTDEKEPFKLLIPVSAIRTVSTALKNSKARVEVGDDDRHIFINIGQGKQFSFRKLTAQFPAIADYLDALSFDHIVKIEAERLCGSLELVGQLVDERNRSIRFALNGDLTLSAASADVGEIKESLDVDFDFEEFETGFNIGYILPIFRQMSGEIEVCFAKSEKTYKDDDGTERVSSVNYPMRVKHFRNNVTSSFDVQSLNIS